MPRTGPASGHRYSADILASMMASVPRSTTCKNLRYLREITGLDQPEVFSSWKIKANLPVQNVPDHEKWRLGLLSKLLEMRQTKFMKVQDSKQITSMTDSLCST